MLKIKPSQHDYADISIEFKDNPHSDVLSWMNYWRNMMNNLNNQLTNIQGIDIQGADTQGINTQDTLDKFIIHTTIEIQ